MAQLVFMDGGEMGRSVALSNRSSIGRAPDNAVVVPDGGVAERHAEVRYDEGRFRIVCSTPGARVGINGREVIEEELHHGDIVTVGAVSLLFSDEGPLAAPPGSDVPGPERRGPTTRSLLFGEGGPGSDAGRKSIEDAEGVLRSFRQSDRLAQHLETLYRTSAALNGTLLLHELVAALMEILTDVFRPDRAFILLVDEMGELRPAVQSISPACRERGFLRHSSSIVQDAVARRRGVFTGSAGADPRFAARESVATPGVRGLLCTPIHKGETILGAIYLDSLSPAVTYEEEDLSLLNGIAAQAALAVENVLSYKRQTEYTRQLISLGETSRRVSALLSQELLVREATESAGRVFDAEKCSILLFDGSAGVLRLEYSLHIPRAEWASIRIAPGERYVGKAFAEGVPVLASIPTPDPKYRTNSFLVVPVFARAEGLGNATRPAGILCATDKRDGRPFDENDEELLTVFAAQVGVALQNARLFEKATVDGLTKLFTRQFFFARLEEEVAAHQARGAPLCAIMADLDHFHDINKHGHHVGDVVLSSSAAVLRRRVARTGGFSGRFGGEEFVAAMPGMSLGRARRIAEEVRAQVEALRLTIDGKIVPVTVSIGVAELGPGDTGEVAVRKADGALLEAKRNGRNRVEVFRG